MRKKIRVDLGGRRTIKKFRESPFVGQHNKNKKTMNKQEREFLNAVKAAVENWGYSYEHYHEWNDFCVDITIDDMDEWAENESDIWTALSEVADEWGAGIDSDCNKYYLGVQFS